jgi:repressor LexA
MKELTARQQEVLDFIRSFSAREGMPPTVREIGARFRVTPRAAFDHLSALERKGMLERRAAGGRRSRSLVPTSRSTTDRTALVPILGRVAAGQPLLAEENRDGALPIAADALPGRGEDLFALRVRGDSMIDAHILDGDLVLVRRQDTARSGDIVVALLEGEATVKRFVADERGVLLKPANPTMAPIAVAHGTDDFRILGKVIGLVRGL